MIRRKLFALLAVVALCAMAAGPVVAKNPMGGGGNGNGNPKHANANGQMRTTTNAQRQAARLAQPVQKKGVTATYAGVNPTTAAFSTLTTSASTLAAMAPSPGGGQLAAPDYFGVPNWANSPLPTIDASTGTISGGLRKFVDPLPGLCYPGGSLGAIPPCPAITTRTMANKYIPVAVATALPAVGNVPASAYYEIALVQYHEQMSSDLPPAGTELRGYVQVVPSTFTNAILLDSIPGVTTTAATAGKYVAAWPSYLGPVIVASGCDPGAADNTAGTPCVPTPVRIKFTNLLPTSGAGDLFIPTDTTYMGAGMDPTAPAAGVDCSVSPKPAGCYAENRATLHLHGGNTPWISDGTPHQWTVAVGEVSAYQSKGDSVAYVPDMWFDASGNFISGCAGYLTCATTGATNNPGQGALSFYWTNQQGGRLMFYHDHAYGITRLNVYAGEAAGYLLTDPAEETALAAATVPGTVPADLGHMIPLVIQDKTFVPDNGTAGSQLAATDPTWDVTKYGGTGNLWFPHVYMPNQNPADTSGANAYGRWDYGPWFWPPQDPTTLVSQPYACTSAGAPAGGWAFPPLMCPGLPNPSGTPEAFMDTPLVNGTAYPTMTVDPTAYRFQVLSAGNDRALNLGLYKADPLTIAVTNGGAGYTAAPTVGFTGGAGGGTGVSATAIVSTGEVTDILVTGTGSGYTFPPNVTITGDGSGATASAIVDPINGQVTAVNVTSGGTGYTAASVAIDAPGCTGCTTATANAFVTPAGSIVAVNVTNPGSLPWTLAPTVSITGTGSGATAIASVNTEVKMVDAVPHTSSSTLPSCTTRKVGDAANPGQVLAAIDASTGTALNGTGLPANCYPTTWPTDGRDGGVPDPTTAGPPFVEIASEGGLLPHASVIPSTPMTYEYNRRSITVLNAFTYGLFLGPAERADVVVDFSKFAGKTLILYNDAPAPVPAFDSRTDYYTGDPDQTSTGGAPSTLPGYGPNTRTILQIKVNATAPAPSTFNLSTLSAKLPGIFASTQPKIIVPEPAFPAANGGTSTPTYVRIQDTSINSWIGGPVGALTLATPGSGYTAVPNVAINGGGGSGATATATLSPASVGSFTVTNGGSGYTTAPTVTLSGGGGAGATATAVLAATGSVKSVAITSGGSGYTTAPLVTFSAPPSGVRATATATVRTNGQRNVTAITITNAGSGYTTAPTITFSGGGGSGAAATATLGKAVASLTLVNGGTGYATAPTVAFSGGGGTGAAATAALATRFVASVTLTNGGNGYTSAPTVVIDPPQTAGATATASVSPPQTGLGPKAIQELFTLDYGRMNATLGVEIPRTNFQTQTTIPYGYVDPPTELLKDGEIQIWKITHNGVDTHFIHFHLFNVQVINRVGWDGAIKPPDLNETGWKDTVRMNPLEDIIVAIRPMQQNLPWSIPNSVRLLDVTSPAGTPLLDKTTNVDPTGQPAAVTNAFVNFGDEYVWHCHILGHEENDMMRAMILGVAPATPGAPTATRTGNGNNQAAVVTWVDQSANETGFTIQRATSAAGPWTTVGTVQRPLNIKGSGATTGGTVSFTDTTVARRTTYVYRVVANNLVGYTQTYAAPTIGYPHTSYDSPPTAASIAITTN